MPEPTNELEKLKAENELLRGLISNAFPLVTGIIENSIQAGHKTDVATTKAARGWLRDSRDYFQPPTTRRSLRGSSE